MTARVSVVIPCFNAAATVGETIASALTQSFRDLEVIIVDDGSTDRSAEIIRSFGDRVIAEFGPNRGASSARNKGTARAAGAYIQYLDADDLLVAEAVEQRVAALDGTGADVAYSDWQRFEMGPGGSRRTGDIVARRMEDVDPDPEIACATKFWAPPAALLYRRGIVDAIGAWHPSLPIIQDARFLFDAARRHARFVHVPGVGAFYYSTGASLSRGSLPAFTRDVFRNGTELQALWEADGPLPQRRKDALAGIFDMTARNFFQLGLPEFDNAVARFKAVSERRFGYPEIAQHVSRLAGRKVALTALGAGVGLARGMKSLFDYKQ
ncbi:MAG TPA: glycosyltransferase [Xanthobacteraceae bacterium]|jgi:glycosyltransferase involved in cell wall biosynthesis|nr:glycosyltransferase [Xanthobacteraceae bacterium]